MLLLKSQNAHSKLCCVLQRRLAYVEHVARKKGVDGCSARWFSNFDSASSALRRRHSLMLLADVAILLQNGSPYVDLGICFEDTLDTAHTAAAGQSLRVLSALLRDTAFFNVLRIRNDLLQGLRDLHAQQSRLDGCSGQSSIAVAFQVRLGWAGGSWIELLEMCAAHFHNSAWLQQVGICPQRGCHGQGDHNVDGFLLTTMEGIARVYFGLIIRTFWLWRGGCYGLVNLLSDDDDLATEAAHRAQLLWPRVLALEQKMAGSGLQDRGCNAFEAGLLWPTGIVWRELHGLLAEGQVAEALPYLWRVHGCHYHEKGASYEDKVLLMYALGRFSLG